MLSKTLKKLRAKPEPTRRLIALTISLGFTALVFVMWGVSFIPYASSELNKASLRDAFPQLDKSANDSNGENTQDTTKNGLDQSADIINFNSPAQNSYSDGTSAFIGSSLEPVYDEYNSISTTDSASNSNAINSDGQSANAQATTSSKVLIQ